MLKTTSENQKSVQICKLFNAMVLEGYETVLVITKVIKKLIFRNIT